MTSVTSTAPRLAQGGVRRAEQPLSVLLRILQARSVLTKRDSAVRAAPTASAHALSEGSPTDSPDHSSPLPMGGTALRFPPTPLRGAPSGGLRPLS